MINQNFKEKRVRFIAWVFSEEEPWRLASRKKFSETITYTLNSELFRKNIFVDKWRFQTLNMKLPIGDTTTYNFTTTAATATISSVNYTIV